MVEKLLWTRDFSLYSYYCSNRIFRNRLREIVRNYFANEIAKRKESVQLLKEKKNIFIKIIFLVRGEKVNWNCIGQIIFFPMADLCFSKRSIFESAPGIRLPLIKSRFHQSLIHAKCSGSEVAVLEK